MLRSTAILRSLVLSGPRPEFIRRADSQIFRLEPGVQSGGTYWHGPPVRIFAMQCRFAIAAALLLSLRPAVVHAAPVTATKLTTKADYARRAKGLFDEARTHYLRDSNNLEAAWQFARACFDHADFAVKSSERAEIAEMGIAAARKAVAQDSKSAAAHYYLGMNLAQLAQTKMLGALKIVNQMESEFSIVRTLDGKFDNAGADRNLGLLYRDAPSIGSIGSRPKARQHLTNAVKIAAESPENRLNLIETYVKWNEKDSAHQELKALESSLPQARESYTGDAWGWSWVDWEARLKKLKAKLGS